MESKLRHLVMKLEILDTIKLAHPFNKGFDNVHFCETEEEAIRIANGEIKAIDGQAGVKTVVTDLKAEQNGDVEKKEDESKFKVYTTTYYVGLEINTGNHFFIILVSHALTHPEISKQIDISWASQEFFETCKTWPSYNEDEHTIHINHTRG